MHPTPTDLVYDGDCGLCRACVEWLQRRDRGHVLTTVTSAACTWPDRDRWPLATTVAVRDARGTWTQSTAVARALMALPRPWSMVGRALWLVNRTPLRRVTDGAYHLVATNRHAISARLVRWGLLSSACLVEPTP